MTDLPKPAFPCLLRAGVKPGRVARGVESAAQAFSQGETTDLSVWLVGSMDEVHEVLAATQAMTGDYNRAVDYALLPPDLLPKAVLRSGDRPVSPQDVVTRHRAVDEFDAMVLGEFLVANPSVIHRASDLEFGPLWEQWLNEGRVDSGEEAAYRGKAQRLKERLANQEKGRTAKKT